MSDLISRQEAIDRINKQREHLEPDVYPQDKIADAAYRICAEFIERLPSAQPEVRTEMSSANDTISRQAAIDEIDEWIKAFRESGHKESAADACLIQDGIIQLPSTQPDDWMERNKKRILQAGMEGREIELRIGGRLFAIREKAQ